VVVFTGSCSSEGSIIVTCSRVFSVCSRSVGEGDTVATTLVVCFVSLHTDKTDRHAPHTPVYHNIIFIDGINEYSRGW
jgi:hypothetical protein